MAAITWQNVAQPNLGSPVADMAAASQMMQSGFNTFGNAIQGMVDTQKKNARADLHNSLLDMAMNADNEKVFLRDAIKLGQESGLTPDQARAEVQSVQGIMKEFLGNTAEQQEQIDAMTQSQQMQEQEGARQIELAMQAFDSRYPQARGVITDMNAFEASGGYGATWEKLSDKFTDGGDRRETMDAVSDMAAKGKYSDYVVSRALQRVGIEEEGLIWDSNLINNKAFKTALSDEKRKVEEAQKNYDTRTALESNLTANLRNTAMTGRQNILDFQKQIREQNKAIFASK